jgi:aspartate/methionine/tyrosine aminotransferase
MKIPSFALERYFARYEFSAHYLLSSSDCEPLSLAELLEMADPESLKMWEGLRLGYTESLGHPALREEVSRLYTGTQPDELLVITPEEGIFIAMNVILEAGDHVISTFPGYQSLYEVAGALGCEVTRWAPVEARGWKFDLEFLKASIRPDTRLIVINFPHNPTGSLPDRGSYQEIIALAEERGITVFSDEMYRFLEYDLADRLEAACDLSAKAVSLCGLSKSFGLPGLRIGWLATRDRDLYTKLAAFKDYTTICSSAPSEALAIMALKAKDEVLRRNQEIVAANLRRLDGFFENRASAFAWTKPRAGTIGFPRLLLPGGSAAFCADLVEKQGTMLLPSTVYSYDDDHFRIGFGRLNMPAALDRLEEYVEDLG